MKTSYIINLTFGTWQNQFWFLGEEGRDDDFKKAVNGLDAIGDSCIHSNDFSEKAVRHFESCGFIRICK